MGWFVPRPRLTDGEAILWRRAANREQGPVRQVGGRLFLTTDRLVFQPNRVDSLTGGKVWSLTRSHVARVTVEPRRPAPPLLGTTARLRNRLRIESAAGDAELFVVSRVSNAIKVLTDALDIHAGA